MDKTVIEVPGGIRYIGDWEEFNDIFPQFPHIMDKAITGCGFTEWCLTNNRNVVLCSPRNILLDNKAEQHPGTVYRVRSEFFDRELGVDKELVTTRSEENLANRGIEDKEESLPGDIQRESMSLYARVNQDYDSYSASRNILPKKILVTYDSFHVVRDVLTDKGIIGTFTIIIDEFQSIFTDARFKSNVELEFVSQLQGLKNVCYLSATPMLDKYLDGIPEFKDLPFYELDWESRDKGRVKKPNLYVKTTRSILEAARKEIERYKSGDYYKVYKTVNDKPVIIESKELVIYVNSVYNIMQIINKCKLQPEEVNILCAKTDKNEKQIKEKLGKGFEIGRVPLENEPRKMFTFCTRTVYIGADFYSDNARSLILSNANVECLAVDISLDLPQILGRQRLWENPWKTEATFYYTPIKSMNTGDKISEEEFEEVIQKKLKTSWEMIENWENSPHKETATNNIKKLIKYTNYKDDYVGITNDGPSINNLVKIAEQRAFDIQQVDYKDRFTVMSAIETVADKVDNEVNMFYLAYDGLRSVYDKLKFICESNLSEEARNIIEDGLPTDMKSYLALGKDRLKALGYNSTKIMRELVSTEVKNKDELSNIIYSEFKVGDRISKKDIKEHLTRIYNDLGINKTAKATDLVRWFKIKEINVFINEKRLVGFKLLSIV